MSFCPKCSRLSEYDSYFGRFYCTSCSWRSEKHDIHKKVSHKLHISSDYKMPKRLIAVGEK